jgi:predicted transcriptional regulator
MTAITSSPIAFKIDQDTKDRVKRLANARQRTPSWLMREAVTQYVEREEKREVFRQEAIKTWQDYEETGLHATGEEVIGWLETWGEETELPAPTCHT